MYKHFTVRLKHIKKYTADGVSGSKSGDIEFNALTFLIMREKMPGFKIPGNKSRIGKSLTILKSFPSRYKKKKL